MTRKMKDPTEAVEETLLTSARAFSIPYRAALAKTRHWRAVQARAIAMVWTTRYVGHTLQDVAGALDMDHSTVAHHRGLHEHRLENEAMYAQAWEEVTRELR